MAAASSSTVDCTTCESTGFVVKDVPCRDCHEKRHAQPCACFTQRPTFCEKHIARLCTTFCYCRPQTLCCDDCVEPWYITKNVDEICELLNKTVNYAAERGLERLNEMHTEHYYNERHMIHFSTYVLTPFLATHSPSTPEQKALLEVVRKKLSKQLKASADFERTWFAVKKTIHDRLQSIDYYIAKRVHYGTLIDLHCSTRITNCVDRAVGGLQVPKLFDYYNEYAQLVQSFTV